MLKSTVDNFPNFLIRCAWIGILMTFLNRFSRILSSFLEFFTKKIVLYWGIRTKRGPLVMVEIIVFRLVKNYLIRTDDLLWLNKVKQSNSSSPLLIKLVYFPGSLTCQILLAQKKFPRLKVG